MNPNTELQNFNSFMELCCIAEYPKQSADGAAATATPETPIGGVGSVDTVPIPLGNCVIHPSSTLAAAGTNFATITVAKRTNGGAPVTLYTYSTAVSSFTAFTPFVIAPAGGAFVTPGDEITLTITKTGTGVIVPALYLAVYPAVT